MNHGDNHCVGRNVAKTLKEFEEEWIALQNLSSSLLKQTSQSSRVPVSFDKSRGGSSSNKKASLANVGGSHVDEDEDDEDPFDCTSLRIPPSHEIADKIANEYVILWKQLDERRVVGNNATTTNEEKENNDSNVDQNATNELNKTLNMNAIDDEIEQNRTIASVKKRNYTDYKMDTGNDSANENVDTDKRKRQPTTITQPKKRLPFHLHRVRLPEGFDYCTTTSDAPDSDDEIQKGNTDRVLSLYDSTTETKLYSKELWNLFKSIPTVAYDIEPSMAISVLPNKNNKDSEDLNNSVEPVFMSRTAAVVNEIAVTSISNKRLDGHAISRFRVNDRHDYIPFNFMYSRNDNPKKEEDKEYMSMRNTSSIATIRLECLLLHREMKRGSSPDSYRMVLEFNGSQTLLDVHDWLVCRMESLLSLPIVTTEQQTEQATATRNDQPLLQQKMGYFFIEDTFYTRCEPFDSTNVMLAPIFDWLYDASLSTQELIKRAAVIGLNLERMQSQLVRTREQRQTMQYEYPFVKSMKETSLYNVSCRLAVRYVYIYHCCGFGDIECAIYVTDRRMLSSSIVTTPSSQLLMFPIVHDTWTQSYTIPDCEACLHRPATIITATNTGNQTRNPTTESQENGYSIENETNKLNNNNRLNNIGLFGQHALCEQCCRQLKLPINMPDKIERYSFWKSQLDVHSNKQPSE